MHNFQDDKVKQIKLKDLENGEKQRHAKSKQQKIDEAETQNQ